MLRYQCLSTIAREVIMPFQMGTRRDVLMPHKGSAGVAGGNTSLLLDAGSLLCPIHEAAALSPRLWAQKGCTGLSAKSQELPCPRVLGHRDPAPLTAIFISGMGVLLRLCSQASAPGAIKRTSSDLCAKAAAVNSLSWGFVSLSPVCATAACIPLWFGKPFAS